MLKYVIKYISHATVIIYPDDCFCFVEKINKKNRILIPIIFYRSVLTNRKSVLYTFSGRMKYIMSVVCLRHHLS